MPRSSAISRLGGRLHRWRWSSPAPAGGFWLLGSGDPVAVVRADAVAYLRALSGRDDDVVLELTSGDATALTPIRQARVAF